jgi:hypothetical protein
VQDGSSEPSFLPFTLGVLVTCRGYFVYVAMYGDRSTKKTAVTFNEVTRREYR